MFGKIVALTAFVFLLSACEPEVGSDAWCKKMIDTPKGDWSMNDASEFAANCVIKTYE